MLRKEMKTNECWRQKYDVDNNFITLLLYFVSNDNFLMHFLTEATKR